MYTGIQREGPVVAGQDRIVKPKEASAITGRSLASMWRDEKAGRFPRRRKIGLKAVGYLLTELVTWIEAREVVTPATVQPVATPKPGKRRGRLGKKGEIIERFKNAMIRAGVAPQDGIIADGKLQVIAGDGWYILNTEHPAAGLYGSRNMDKPRRWACKKISKMTAEEESDFKIKMEAMKKERKSARTASQTPVGEM